VQVDCRSRDSYLGGVLHLTWGGVRTEKSATPSEDNRNKASHKKSRAVQSWRNTTEGLGLGRCY